MNGLGLDLPLFLDLLSWGHADCITHPKIRYARTALMVSKELPSIIARWHQPPRSHQSTHRRAQGGRMALERFAFTCVGAVIQKELDAIRDVLACPKFVHFPPVLTPTLQRLSLSTRLNCLR